MSGGADKLKELARSVTRAARAYVDEALDRRITAATDLHPIDRTQPEDLFVCGYPKSGNTWFQHMCTALVYGVDVQWAPDTLINDLVPDVHFKKYYRRYGTPSFFKSHHLPLPAYRRVVYLLRDGRDAMVSYYHHLSATSTDVDFRQMVLTGRGLFPGKWHDHVESYLANAHGAEMMVIRYETLRRDTLGELRRFCEFARLERGDETLRWAIERASFENMRKKEQRAGWETPGWPRDKPFVRRGQVGSFRDEMPPEVLETFMREAGRTLSAQGYT